MAQKDPGPSQAGANLNSTFQSLQSMEQYCDWTVFWHMEDTIIGAQSGACPHMQPIS